MMPPNIESHEFSSYDPYTILRNPTILQQALEIVDLKVKGSLDSALLDGVYSFVQPFILLQKYVIELVANYEHTAVIKKNIPLIRFLIKNFSSRKDYLHEELINLIIIVANRAFKAYQWRALAEQFNIIPMAKGLLKGIYRNIFKGESSIIIGKDVLVNYKKVAEDFQIELCAAILAYLVNLNYYYDIDIEKIVKWLEENNFTMFSDEDFGSAGPRMFISTYVIPHNINVFSDKKILDIYLDFKPYEEYFCNSYKNFNDIASVATAITSNAVYFKKL